MSFSAEHRAKTYAFPTVTTTQISVEFSLEVCSLSLPQIETPPADMLYFNFHTTGSGIKKEQLMLQCTFCQNRMRFKLYLQKEMQTLKYAREITLWKGQTECRCYVLAVFFTVYPMRRKRHDAGSLFRTGRWAVT